MQVTKAMIDAACAAALDRISPVEMEMALEAALRAAGVPQRRWPAKPEQGRREDMGTGHLRVGMDSDCDVYVSVWDGEKAAGVEFCNPGGGGGGRSGRTRQALLDLMLAMEADNAETPALAWPRIAGAQT